MIAEALVAIATAIVFVVILLVILVAQIEPVVESGVPDQFLGLILLPLVEKAAEHLTSIDEAWDGVINVALYHCIGPSIQTALFNAPLVVLVGWALGKPMDLNFEIFMIVLLVLSILVVGNFLRDQESNWLEGSLLVVSHCHSLVLSIPCANNRLGRLCHHRDCVVLLSKPGCCNKQWSRGRREPKHHDSSRALQAIDCTSSGAW